MDRVYTTTGFFFLPCGCCHRRVLSSLSILTTTTTLTTLPGPRINQPCGTHAELLSSSILRVFRVDSRLLWTLSEVGSMTGLIWLWACLYNGESIGGTISKVQGFYVGAVGVGGEWEWVGVGGGVDCGFYDTSHMHSRQERVSDSMAIYVYHIAHPAPQIYTRNPHEIPTPYFGFISIYTEKLISHPLPPPSILRPKSSSRISPLLLLPPSPASNDRTTPRARG
jgi:hypothetical protein